MAKYLLGIDAGTSVVKCCVLDLEGRELGTAARKVPVDVPKPNHAEQDMMKVWRGVTEIIPEVISTSGIDAKDIVGIGITGQGDGSWLIDKEGNPVGPAILWTDGRAIDVVNRWNKDGVTDWVFDITGTGPYTGSTSSILRWRIENQPELLEKAYRILWCNDWVQYKMTGVICTDESNPSLLGLDIKNRTYSEKMLELSGLKSIKHLLPKIVSSMDLVGNITEEAAKATGLVAGTPVVKGMFDVVATATGVGAVNAGDACSIMGTTCFNEAVLAEPAFEPRNVGMSICHGVPNLWLKAMGVNYGTPNLDWFLKEFGSPYYKEAEERGINIFELLEEVVSNTAPGCDGIIYSPYLCPGGERAPFVKPEARAQFFGLTDGHTRDQMLRAVYEGVAFAMRDCYESIPGETSNVRLAGGGAKSEIWCQILADVTGKIMRVPAGTEFGAKGVAIAAGVAVGIYQNINSAVAQTVHFDREYLPNPDNTKKFDALYPVYRKLRDDVFETWDLLAAARKAL